jgi:hypothetical protein
MNKNFLKHLILIALVVASYSCSKNNGEPGPISPPPSIGTEGLSKIEDVLNGDDQDLIELRKIFQTEL